MDRRGTTGLRVDLRGVCGTWAAIWCVLVFGGKTQKWVFAGGSRQCGSGVVGRALVRFDTNNAGGPTHFRWKSARSAAVAALGALGARLSAAQRVRSTAQRCGSGCSALLLLRGCGSGCARARAAVPAAVLLLRWRSHALRGALRCCSHSARWSAALRCSARARCARWAAARLRRIAARWAARSAACTLSSALRSAAWRCSSSWCVMAHSLESALRGGGQRESAAPVVGAALGRCGGCGLRSARRLHSTPLRAVRLYVGAVRVQLARCVIGTAARAEDVHVLSGLNIPIDH